MNEVAIRPAQAADAAGINEVYNPYIRDSAATFETHEYSEGDRRAWLDEHAASGDHPVFVAEAAEGVICGFANAGSFDPRGGYATSVKTSVFVSKGRHGAGVARRLYDALFTALSGTRAHRAYALIVTPNAASVALHQAFGFVRIATLDEVGRKFGRYHSVMWFEKRL